MSEKVNNPEHYGGKKNTYEAIKVIEAHNLDFCLGNAVITKIMKIGDKVKIVNHYKHDPIYNPLDQEGTVITMQGGKFSNVIVEWPNGVRNSYSEKSLAVV